MSGIGGSDTTVLRSGGTKTFQWNESKTSLKEGDQNPTAVNLHIIRDFGMTVAASPQLLHYVTKETTSQVTTQGLLLIHILPTSENLHGASGYNLLMSHSSTKC